MLSPSLLPSVPPLLSQGAYGAGVDVKAFQAQPRTPVQTLLDRQKEVASRSGEFAAAKQSADSPYSQYAVTKMQQCECTV